MSAPALLVFGRPIRIVSNEDRCPREAPKPGRDQVGRVKAAFTDENQGSMGLRPPTNSVHAGSVYGKFRERGQLTSG
jgi:hypothetical protein